MGRTIKQIATVQRDKVTKEALGAPRRGLLLGDWHRVRALVTKAMPEPSHETK